MTISDETLKQIKDIPFTDILDVEGIPYKKLGKEAVTLCPWHSDSNPSLTINNDKNFCFCFVCQLGNDAIGFLQQKIGLDFADTIARIADSHNLVVVHDNIDPKLAVLEAKKRAEALAAIEQQQDKFRENLKDPRATRIRDILFDRNIEPPTCRYFGIGYCASGFFADRITVPIYDHRGTLVGFTGRATRDEVKPKYKNSENDEYFDKSRIVFNEHRATAAAREADSIIFVEGHFDVISLWQYGIKNVVAMQGTAAPSESIIRRLARRTKRFILCYDSDEGGEKAIENFLKVAGPMACRGDISVSIATLPQGKDPDEVIREGLIDFHQVIENSVTWLDWQLDVWLNNLDRSDTVKFTLIEQKIRELVESIGSPSLRQYYIDKASKNLAADQQSAIKIAKSWAENSKSLKIKRRWQKPTPQHAKLDAEKKLLRLYVHHPEMRKECEQLMDKLESPSHRWLWQRIREIEQHDRTSDLPNTLMAVLAVCEPYYTRQLRPIAMPTIKVLNNPGILKHIRKSVKQELLIDGI